MGKNKTIIINIIFLLAIFAAGIYFVPRVEPAIQGWHIALILGGVVVFTLISEYRKR